MSDKTAATVRMSSELYEHLSLIASARGISVNAACVTAITSYVEKGRKDEKVTAAIESRLRSFLE